MAFDLQSHMTNFFGSRRLKRAGMGLTRFHFGARSAKFFSKLPNVEVLEESGILSKLAQSDFPDNEAWQMGMTTDRLRAMRIVHVRFR